MRVWCALSMTRNTGLMRIHSSSYVWRMLNWYELMGRIKMTKHLKLFTPGPGDVDEDVLASLATPILRHYGPEWMEIYNETHGPLKQVFRTKNEIFFVPGPASSLMDMAIGSLLATGEKIIVGENGFFGERLILIARGYGLQTVTLSAPLGKPLDPK